MKSQLRGKYLLENLEAKEFKCDWAKWNCGIFRLTISIRLFYIACDIFRLTMSMRLFYIACGIFRLTISICLFM
jgi:hypothetical protein